MLGLSAPVPGAAGQANGATDRRPIPAVRLAAPPVIDGDLSDPAWQQAARAEGFADRQSGSRQIDQTTALLGYDDENVYVAFDCVDSQPGAIVGRETVRDSLYTAEDADESEDHVQFTLDPFLTRQFGDLSRFAVNVLGTPSARIGGGRARKTEWQGDWSAAAKRHARGWSAELRIPWKMLNYPSGGRAVTMGINFTRFQHRTRVESVWSNTGPQHHLERMGLWTGVQPPAAAFRPEVSLLPYLLPGVRRGDPSLRAGLDARFAATPELTAVATLNPDFATIEGAVESIAFSRSERFVPDRRPFFLEGERHFQAGRFYSVGHHFYPPRIPAFDVGVKAYGKLRRAGSLGVLSTVDFGRRADTIASYRHSLSDTSTAQVFLSQKSAVDDTNTVGVLLQETRWGKFSVESEVGFSAGNGAGGGTRQVGLGYGDKHIFHFLQYLDVSPSFRNANGLTFFTDRRGFTGFFDWNAEWRRGFWRGFNVEFFPLYTWHSDGRPFERGASLDIALETRSDWRLALSTRHSRFDSERDATWGLRVVRGASNRFLKVGLGVEQGIVADRPYSLISPEASLRLFRRLDIGYGGALERLAGSHRQHVATATYEISPTRSVGGRVVVENAHTNWYLSFRSSGQAGTEVFFILGDPNARRFQEQAFVKLVFAL